MNDNALKPALNRLMAAGIRAPWEKADGPSRGEVSALWISAARSVRISPHMLIDAVDTWLSNHAEGDRWWPSPADVISLVPRQVAEVASCGRCDEHGRAQVAWHFRKAGETHVETRSVCCDCARGAATADASTKWPKGQEQTTPRPRAEQLTAYCDRIAKLPYTVAVYPFPTRGEQRADLREPTISLEASHKLYLYLESLAISTERRPPPPDDADRYGRDDDGGRW